MNDGEWHLLSNAALTGAFAAWVLAIIVAVALPPWRRSDLRTGGETTAVQWRRVITCAWLALGCLGVVVAGVGALAAQTPDAVTLVTWDFFGNGGILLDPLAGWFLVVTGSVGCLVLIGAVGALHHIHGRLSERALMVLAAVLLATVTLIFIADNGFAFLLAWEMLSLVFYGLTLIAYDRRDTATAAFITGALPKIAGGALIAAFLLLFAASHSFQFADWAALAATAALGEGMRGLIFVLALIGFGAKIGMLPLQGWMPRGYAVAPGFAPALMAGVALNAGFYGIARLVFTFLGDRPAWLGIVLLLLGGLTAFGGILYGLARDRLRALLAYSSIENGGIILIGFGIAAVALNAHVVPLAALAFTAALLHIAGHSLAKALVFLGAEQAESLTGNRSMTALGGLVQRAPWVAGTFFLGAATLTALPPLSNFTSEWLIFLSLLQSFRLNQIAAQVAAALVAALLALASSCAVVAFVKCYGATFLGQPRQLAPSSAGSVTGATRLALGGLAGLVLLLSIAMPWVLPVVGSVAVASLGITSGPRLVNAQGIITPAYAGIASIAPTYLAVVIPAFIVIGSVITYTLVRRWRGAPRGVRTVRPWISGAAPATLGYQYTPLGFTNPMRVIFGGIFRTQRQLMPQDGDTISSAIPLFPATLRFTTHITQVIEAWFYRPLVRIGLWLNAGLRRTQSGNLGLYITYILILVVIVLILFPIWGL